MFYRLRSEFHLSVIVMFAAAAVVGLLPLAIYRLISGSSDVAAVDAALVAFVCAAAFYAWHTGDTRRTGWFMVAVSVGVGVAMTHILGQPGLYGMFTALLTSFLLVDRRKAAVIAAAALFVVAVDGKAFSSISELVAFLVNGVLVSVFAYIFAARTAMQRAQLEALATHDALTGLHNRRAMESELRIAVETFRRNRVGVGLVMLDLDHFKRINDVFGHEAGDEVLVAFARILRHATRKVDRVFRFGGEEFVMLFPGVDVPGLRTVTENLRSKIAAELRCPDGKVTTSFGAALLRPNEEEHGWLARADTALYRAKAEGRDRFVIDEREEPVALADA
jgi:diguanylate cyclase (GGDEF)-like protein